KATRLCQRIRIITTVSPTRTANETTNCTPGKGVAARAAAAGAAVPSYCNGLRVYTLSGGPGKSAALLRGGW
ncbi:MAG: hypothetical protein ACJ732_01720, partial [Rubrobacteraceae bacterium]